MIRFEENQLTVEQYLSLREQVQWKVLTDAQGEKALKHSLYVLCALEDDVPVGMGRLVGDGAVICYIQDLIVVPEAQSQGLGGQLIQRLIAQAKTLGLPGTTLMLDLMCAKGRESFYANYGFLARPTEALGPGMIQYLEL